VRGRRGCYCVRSRLLGGRVTLRTRLRDDLHALGRPAAFAAVAAALGGVVALRFPASSAWELVATVDALGTADESTVAVLSALEATRAAWAGPVCGVVVVVVALLVAIDRPPPAAELVLLVAAAGMVAVAFAVVLARPELADFAALGRAVELVEGPAALPDGVEITLSIAPAPGPVALGVAAAVVAAGTLVATRRG
jgi:hypothetical protein